MHPIFSCNFGKLAGFDYPAKHKPKSILPNLNKSRFAYKHPVRLNKGFMLAPALSYGSALPRVVRYEKFPISVYRQYYTDIVGIPTLIREENPSP